MPTTISIHSGVRRARQRFASKQFLCLIIACLQLRQQVARLARVKRSGRNKKNEIRLNISVFGANSRPLDHRQKIALHALRACVSPPVPIVGVTDLPRGCTRREGGSFMNRCFLLHHHASNSSRSTDACSPRETEF